MNNRKNIVKKNLLETVFTNDVSRSKIYGIGVIFLSIFVPYSTSQAVQPKAGDIILTMPTDKVLIEKWSKTSSN